MQHKEMSTFLSIKDTQGWSQMTAKIHNKEMHAINGNINSQVMIASHETRENSMRRDFIQGQHSEQIRCITQEDFSEILEQAEKYSFQSYQCDSNGHHVSYVAAGTLHELAQGTLMPNIEQVAGDSNMAERESTQEVGINITNCPTDASALENVDHTEKGESQHWIGVGFDRTVHYGKLMLTDMGKEMMKDELINVNFAKKIYKYKDRAFDWRELGIRVALYDDLRERRFTQPTGVDWSIAVKEKFVTEYTSTVVGHHWGFDAVAVTWECFNSSLKCDNMGNLGLPVEEGLWALNRYDVVVIGLADDSLISEMERDIWILSHLDYPLVFGLDTFQLVEQENAYEPTLKPRTFVRTSSLVDVHSKARHIIFVIMNDSLRPLFPISLAGVEFEVTSTMSGRNKLHPQNVDDIVNKMLKRVMLSYECLKEAFEHYAKNFFAKGSLDWTEVNNLASILKVRWHNRMEAVVHRDEKKLVKRYMYIPKNFAKRIGIHIENDSDTKNYGSKHAVSTLDHVFLPTRALARQFPALRIGKWNNITEIGVVSGLAVYCAFDAKNLDQISSGISAGGMDSLVRAGYWRRIIENWKRQNGLRDEIASPSSYRTLNNYWTMFVGEFTEEESSLAKLANLLCGTKYRTWSWRGNKQQSIVPSNTGIRTPSCWWHADLNETWVDFKIGSNGMSRGFSSSYSLNSEVTRWYYNYRVPDMYGADNFRLELALNRLNLEKDVEGIEYMALPSMKQETSYGYAMECVLSIVLAKAAGWTMRNYDPVSNFNIFHRWGWGLSVVIRDWENDTLKKICLEKNVGTVLENSGHSKRSQLFQKLKRKYLHKSCITDLSQIKEV